ncbi:MAG TPA: hypothetical protein VGB44_11200 [Flavobacterium sp.]|jgi:hypothetical protein
MPEQNEAKLRKIIRNLIILFIICLVISGVTAFPIETELAILDTNRTILPTSLQDWIHQVYLAVKSTNDNYPYLSYGTDWLAFAHIVIAVAFIGPLRDPVRNIWVIQFGMISSIMVFPLAFIAGPLRGIPFYWQLIDCSFGVFGFLLLYLCYTKILKLEKIQNSTSIRKESYANTVF